MKKISVCRFFCLVAAVVLMLTAVGCNMELHQKNESYVSQVKQLVNDSVTYTRKLWERDNEFDCRSSEKIRGYLLVADDLINTLDQLQKLKATDEFDEMDKPLKESAKQALILISQLKAMVVYAQESGDDAIYQREKGSYLNDYYTCYDNMKELSSEIQTYWRNA